MLCNNHSKHLQKPTLNKESKIWWAQDWTQDNKRLHNFMTFFNGLVYKMLKMFSRCQIRFHDIARMLNLPMSFWGLSDQRSHDHCALQRALNILKSFLITFRTLIVNFSMIKGSSILVFLFLPLFSHFVKGFNVMKKKDTNFVGLGRLNELGHKVVGLPNNSYKPIINTAWVHPRVCKLQKRVHSTGSRKW